MENIAPENWKTHRKEIKNLKKLAENKIADNCSSPFHFLIKNIDLSKQRPTICKCSRLQTLNQVYKFRNIETFFNLKNVNKECKESCASSLVFPHNKGKRPLYITREDRIRGAHDRVKRSHLGSESSTQTP